MKRAAGGRSPALTRTGLEAYNSLMYVRNVRISDLRCFKRAALDFRYPGEGRNLDVPNVTLLLGNNGAGKSTVMRAIALAVLSPILSASGYVPVNLVRRGSPSNPWGTLAEANVAVHPIDRLKAPSPTVELSVRVLRKGDYELFVEGQPIWTSATHGPEAELRELWEDRSPSFFVVGYGATRFVGSSEESVRYREARRGGRYERVASLFEEQVPLTPLSAWLPTLDEARWNRRWKEVIELMNRLLPVGTRFLNRREHGEYLFSSSGVDVPASSLSDGFRSYVGWISDLLYHMTAVCPPDMLLKELPGVVMVDEIDLHLHPEWQREVIGTIARELPALQFVLSTHSPIVAGTLHADNIYLMERGEDGTATARQLDERIHGRNADEILVSSYFNLATTRAPGMVDQLKDLSNRAMSGDSDAAVAFLHELSAGGKK